MSDVVAAPSVTVRSLPIASNASYFRPAVDGSAG